MPYKITNVSLEHQHTLKRRMASRLQMEPVIAGKRLLLRQSMPISDEQYCVNKDLIDQCVRDGIISIEPTMPFIPPLINVASANKLEFATESVEDGTIETGPSAEAPKVMEARPPMPQQNNPPSGGFNQQRRDDRKRGR